MKFNEWDSFKPGEWCFEINVRDFIQHNYTPYTGNADFLADATDRTKELWNTVMDLYEQERKNNGVLAVDADTVSTITSHKPGYINQALEQIVGLQTDAPLKRAIMPNGGIRIVEKSCEAQNVKVSE